MQYLLLVYVDPTLLDALPEAEFNARMRHCLHEADALHDAGTLIDCQQLEPAQTAKAVRRRSGKVTVVDGPFAETKEMLAGFNLVETDSLEEAIRLAERLPWADTGCIEVRPVRDIDAVRRRVGAERSTTA